MGYRTSAISELVCATRSPQGELLPWHFHIMRENAQICHLVFYTVECKLYTWRPFEDLANVLRAIGCKNFPIRLALLHEQEGHTSIVEIGENLVPCGGYAYWPDDFIVDNSQKHGSSSPISPMDEC